MRWPLILGFVVAACTPNGTQPTQPATSLDPSTTSVAESPSTTTTAPEEADLDVVCFDGEGGFEAGGSLGAFPRSSTDAALLTGIRWQQIDGCERIFLDFATPEGAPATEPPPMSAVFMRPEGVLRIELGTEIKATSIAEQLIETELVGEAFAVRALDGTLFLDIHLLQPALARMSMEEAPARAIIDLKPGGSEMGGRPFRNADVVVVVPTGPVSYPFSIAGYTRSPTTPVEVSVTSLMDGSTRLSTGEIITRGDAWSEFVITFTEGPPGMVVINVADSLQFELMAS